MEIMKFSHGLGGVTLLRGVRRMFYICGMKPIFHLFKIVITFMILLKHFIITSQKDYNIQFDTNRRMNLLLLFRIKSKPNRNELLYRLLCISKNRIDQSVLIICRNCQKLIRAHSLKINIVLSIITLLFIFVAVRHVTNIICDNWQLQRKIATSALDSHSEKSLLFQITFYVE